MTEVKWLSTDEQVAWRTYLRGVSVVLDTLNQDLESEHSVSLSEYEVLSHLSEAPERTIRMSTLAERLVHSRSRLTHTVRRLEKRGFVMRVPCQEDGRGVNCVLTDPGFEKLRIMAPSHVRSVRRCLVDKLGHDQMIELGRLCEQLLDSTDDYGPDPAGTARSGGPARSGAGTGAKARAAAGADRRAKGAARGGEGRKQADAGRAEPAANDQGAA
ncbi:MAG: MarR family winged helix-turn-helix transcriptional regulator [Actinomycetaceae bacterium]|nr:MarR family winged helix-turn-helix transcriptional regulator [Actinomycetaceae bacterium]